MEAQHETGQSAAAMERPRYPRCASRETVVKVPGLMAGPPPSDAPSWMRYVGCVIDSRSCSCEVCGFDWDFDYESGSTVIENEQRLFELTRATNDDDLAVWLNDEIDLDCWVMRDENFESGLVLRISNSGVPIEFPTTRALLLERLRDLEADVIEEQTGAVEH